MPGIDRLRLERLKPRGLASAKGMQATHMQAQKTIDGIGFPVTRAELVDYAVRRGADEELLADLRRLPERVYEGPNAVGAAFAEVTGR
jgi:hypothetical protein